MTARSEAWPASISAKKIFLHINNSNPALLHDSAERKMAERAGWQIPADGTEITL